MTTFTARELHRETARVLATVESEGGALIVRRDGKRFEVRQQVEGGAKRRRKKVPDFIARMRRQGMPKVSRAVSEAVDRAIAGE